jgi:hypothetical protein
MGEPSQQHNYEAIYVKEWQDSRHNILVRTCKVTASLDLGSGDGSYWTSADYGDMISVNWGVMVPADWGVIGTAVRGVIGTYFWGVMANVDWGGMGSAGWRATA